MIDTRGISSVEYKGEIKTNRIQEYFAGKSEKD